MSRSSSAYNIVGRQNRIFVSISFCPVRSQKLFRIVKEMQTLLHIKKSKMYSFKKISTKSQRIDNEKSKKSGEKKGPSPPGPSSSRRISIENALLPDAKSLSKSSIFKDDRHYSLIVYQRPSSSSY